MIHSMTAFARHEVKARWGTAVWEIRSVNQRYLESYFRLPEQFRGLESLLRDKLRNSMQRGKVEINLRYNAAQKAGELKINDAFAAQLMQVASNLVSKCPQAQLNVADILRWPGVMETQEEDLDGVQAELLAGFDIAMKDFLAGRGREGQGDADRRPQDGGRLPELRLRAEQGADPLGQDGQTAEEGARAGRGRRGRPGGLRGRDAARARRDPRHRAARLHRPLHRAGR